MSREGLNHRGHGGSQGTTGHLIRVSLGLVSNAGLESGILALYRQ
jgi:hypothetical protein